MTEKGTILLYYETESFPGSNRFVNIKHELSFNNDSNIIEELIRDESGRVVERKKFLPSYTESSIE